MSGYLGTGLSPREDQTGESGERSRCFHRHKMSVGWLMMYSFELDWTRTGMDSCSCKSTRARDHSGYGAFLSWDLCSWWCDRCCISRVLSDICPIRYVTSNFVPSEVQLASLLEVTKLLQSKSPTVCWIFVLDAIFIIWSIWIVRWNKRYALAIWVCRIYLTLLQNVSVVPCILMYADEVTPGNLTTIGPKHQLNGSSFTPAECQFRSHILQTCRVMAKLESLHW